MQLCCFLLASNNNKQLQVNFWDMITDATLDSSYEHLEQPNKESVYSIDKDNTSTLTSYFVTLLVYCFMCLSFNSIYTTVLENQKGW